MRKLISLKYLTLLAGILLFCLDTAAVSALNLSEHPDIQTYINQIATAHGFSKAQLRRWFTQAEFDPIVIQKITRPYEDKTWHSYFSLFVNNHRAEKGVIFWEQNQRALAVISKKYGVPPEVIVSILGVETNYGDHTGKFPVFNTLTTLSFDYPKRADFFRNELTQFLLLSRQRNWNPMTVKGSYAGALGYPQFMPSSYMNYAVAF